MGFADGPALARKTVPGLLNRWWWRLGLPLLALTLLIGGSGVFAYRSLSANIRAETHRTLTVIAEQKRQQIEGWLAQARSDAQLYFSGTSQARLLFSQWLDGGRRDQMLLTRMQERLTDLMGARQWGGVALSDAAGGPVLAIGEAAPAVHEAQIQALLHHPEAPLTELHRNAEGRVLYCVMAAIGAPGDPPLGVALLTWLADQTLFPLVSAWPVPTRSAETYLVEPDGERVRFLTPLRFQSDAALVMTRPRSAPGLTAARVVEGERGIIVDGQDYRGVPVLAYGTPIAGTPWFMIAEIDLVEADAGLQATVWATGLVMGLGLLVVYGVGFLLWHRTRQRQELDELRARDAADARFRLLFEQHLAVMLQIDPVNGRILDANQAAADFYGYSREALRAMSITQINCLPPEKVETQWHQAEHRTRSDFIFPHRLADGRIRTVEVHAAAITLDDHPVIFSIIHDITDRQQIEERLRLSEERYRLIAEHASDLIWTMGLDGRMTYMSPSTERLYGFTPAEAMQQSLAEMVVPASLPIVLAGLARTVEAVAAGRPMETLRMELEEYCKDGSTIWTETNAGGVYDAGGRFVEILGITRDISQRKRYEQGLQEARGAAEAASAAKSAFLAHMSHEIRTPLNAVLGLAQVLEKGALSPDQGAMVAQISTAGRSLLGILNDILDLSKIEAGQLQLETRPFALAPLLAQVESLLGPTARGKGLGLSIVAPPAASALLAGDPLRLEQVLINLIGNAIKFTEQGAVDLRVEPLAETAADIRWRFAVTDTGIGIAPETLAGLFSPFTQADGSITRRFGGTGLGLSICKRLVELMGGEIGATSTPGAGSTFWFELGLARAAGAAPVPSPVPAPAAPTGPRLAGRHLLVVDDSPMNREVVVRMLALEGARTTQAADGRQALDLLGAQPLGFDAVLMDVQMPVMDGLTATRAIRDTLGLARLPIIALTAGVLPEQQAQALAAGVDGVLAKPLDLGQMVALLASRLEPRVFAPVPLEPPAVRPAGSHEPAAAFPEIPGIDRDRAARTLNQDRALFLRLLGRFADEFADAVALATADLDRGERERAVRRLHSLRGTAGYLGALDLMHAAGELEQAVAAGETGLAGRLGALGEQVSALIAASAPWRRPVDLPPAGTAAGTPLDPARLAALRLALSRQKGSARRLFQELEPALRGRLDAADIERLGQAIRDLRFDQALAILAPLFADAPAAEPPRTGPAPLPPPEAR